VYVKTAKPTTEMPYGADSCGPEEPCIRWVSRSDEFIRHCEG